MEEAHKLRASAEEQRELGSYKDAIKLYDTLVQMCKDKVTGNSNSKQPDHEDSSEETPCLGDVDDWFVYKMSFWSVLLEQCQRTWKLF